MTNDELEAYVTAELLSDPKVNSRTIAVAAEDGTVTLRGTVGSVRQKREARKAAQRVGGVVFVNDELDVRILGEHRREDAELRGDVLQALMLDAAVPTTVEATVRDGVVTLSGVATWQYQREEAEFIAGNVMGVAGMWNEIRLATPTPDTGEVRDSVRRALLRAAAVEADEIEVDSLNGRVKLTGSVGSWWEHDAVLAAAWHIPGVEDIDDRLSIRN
jgi:osmotically-inducible protein OsmY